MVLEISGVELDIAQSLGLGLLRQTDCSLAWLFAQMAKRAVASSNLLLWRRSWRLSDGLHSMSMCNPHLRWLSVFQYLNRRVHRAEVARYSRRFTRVVLQINACVFCLQIFWDDWSLINLILWRRLMMLMLLLFCGFHRVASLLHYSKLVGIIIDANLKKIINDNIYLLLNGYNQIKT